VTSAPRHIMVLEIGMLNFNFDAVIRAQLDDGMQKKPHPQALDECIKLIGVNKDKACYIGNSPEDMEMARNAGVFGTFLDRGDHIYDKINCDAVIYSLYTLRTAI